MFEVLVPTFKFRVKPSHQRFHAVPVCSFGEGLDAFLELLLTFGSDQAHQSTFLSPPEAIAPLSIQLIFTADQTNYVRA